MISVWWDEWRPEVRKTWGTRVAAGVGRMPVPRILRGAKIEDANAHGDMHNSRLRQTDVPRCAWAVLLLQKKGHVGEARETTVQAAPSKDRAAPDEGAVHGADAR